MQCQVDQFEAEIESLVGAAGKKKKGKSDADARSEECQQWVSASDCSLAPLVSIWETTLCWNCNVLLKVEKHRDHIQKLETLLRMLDNDQVCGFINIKSTIMFVSMISVVSQNFYVIVDSFTGERGSGARDPRGDWQLHREQSGELNYMAENLHNIAVGH